MSRIILGERLQKVLARAGIGSRREIEMWIRAGRIHINRQVAALGDRVNLQDDIRIDGRKLRSTALHTPARQILCYYKPTGEVCSRRDPEGRPTIFDKLPRPRQGRWISVGRLDFNTAGLLLLTTDGELAHRLMHPSYVIEREYAVRILGEVDDAMLARLKTGVLLEDGEAHFLNILNAGGDGANHWYHVVVTEGRKHEVRRLWESQGVTVSRLLRIRYGPIMLPKGLHMGKFVDLSKENEDALLNAVGLYEPPPPVEKKPPKLIPKGFHKKSDMPYKKFKKGIR